MTLKILLLIQLNRIAGGKFQKLSAKVNMCVSDSFEFQQIGMLDKTRIITVLISFNKKLNAKSILFFDKINLKQQ